MSGILMMAVGNSYGSAPVNTVAPVVTGTAAFGSTLTTTNGTWLGAPAPTFTYQWFRSPSTSISGATSSTYVLVAGDVGFGIFCQVRATNAVAPSGVTADSNTTATVVAIVPGAPTIGTATATGTTTATVAYTAPASNGGATITSYTATSSPGGVTGSLSTSGSGTITVSGLSPSTNYTFTVYATNSIGNSAASSASNSITTATPVVGTDVYTTPGTYTWVAPTGVTAVSVVCVGAGGTYGYAPGYGTSGGGGGGALAYANNITVSPGSSYTVVVGAGVAFNNDGSPGGNSTFNGTSVGAQGGRSGQRPGTPNGAGGTVLNGTGGSGGTGGTGNLSGNYPGGGGAGGYAGAGGNGGTDAAGANGSGGGGGGGAARSGGSGGGVGITGQGTSGTGGTYNGGVPGANGTGGSSNPTSPSNIPQYAQYGGAFGVNQQSGSFTSSGGGAVRIIYPGDTRTYPNNAA